MRAGAVRLVILLALFSTQNTHVALNVSKPQGPCRELKWERERMYAKLASLLFNYTENPENPRRVKRSQAPRSLYALRYVHLATRLVSLEAVSYAEHPRRVEHWSLSRSL